VTVPLGEGQASVAVEKLQGAVDLIAEVDRESGEQPVAEHDLIVAVSDWWTERTERSPEGDFGSEAHHTHDDHDHTHGSYCGHPSEQHGDHIDYLHDGHRHREHEGHWDECEQEAEV
jgi:hypothetical protein